MRGRVDVSGACKQNTIVMSSAPTVQKDKLFHRQYCHHRRRRRRLQSQSPRPHRRLRRSVGRYSIRRWMGGFCKEFCKECYCIRATLVIPFCRLVLVMILSYWLNGWMNGWMDARMDGWVMDRWVDGWVIDQSALTWSTVEAPAVDINNWVIDWLIEWLNGWIMINMNWTNEWMNYDK